MTAKIDIKTPAGKSLEGFPFEGDLNDRVFIDYLNSEVYNSSTNKWISVHKGDTITIEIL